MLIITLTDFSTWMNSSFIEPNSNIVKYGAESNGLASLIVQFSFGKGISFLCSRILPNISVGLVITPVVTTSCFDLSVLGISPLAFDLFLGDLRLFQLLLSMYFGNT